LHQPIDQGLGIIKTTKNEKAARAFAPSSLATRASDHEEVRYLARYRVHLWLIKVFKANVPSRSELIVMVTFSPVVSTGGRRLLAPFDDLFVWMTETLELRARRDRSRTQGLVARHKFRSKNAAADAEHDYVRPQLLLRSEQCASRLVQCRR
jgi:hypothetical protein